MSERRVERRLAAILAVDVAGYSRLMGTDEEGTLAALRAIHRELGDPKIKDHRGRIVKTTGDGLLVDFSSVVDAVRCAVEVQREMAVRNTNIPPERRIEFRMGINLGDIIVEDGDIFGDGVNVAARLEGLADPGGICASRVVRDQVRDKLDFSFEDMGEQQVKNIARPVRARCRWAVRWSARTTCTARRARRRGPANCTRRDEGWRTAHTRWHGPRRHARCRRPWRSPTVPSPPERIPGRCRTTGMPNSRTSDAGRSWDSGNHAYGSSPSYGTTSTATSITLFSELV